MNTVILFIMSIFLFAQTYSPSEKTFRRTQDNAFPSKKIRPVVLPDGRVVVTVADTIYVLGGDQEPLWKYSTNGETFSSEPAFNAELNEVAAVGFDLLFVRLDATTGKEKWKAETNGRASFSTIAAYGKGYLVVVEMAGYRQNDRLSDNQVSDSDKLEYWGSSEGDSWSIAFPMHAELVVDGKRVFALRRSRDAVRLQEMQIPRKTVQ